MVVREQHWPAAAAVVNPSCVKDELCPRCSTGGSRVNIDAEVRGLLDGRFWGDRLLFKLVTPVGLVRSEKGKEAALWTNVSCQRAGCHRQAQHGKLDMPPSCPSRWLFFVSSFVLTAALACNGVEAFLMAALVVLALDFNTGRIVHRAVLSKKPPCTVDMCGPA